jgi:hypothetical protein
LRATTCQIHQICTRGIILSVKSRTLTP